MELQFDKSTCRYLKKLNSHSQSQEQTQEIRIPDNMPDVGRVLGCWGQPVLRGKEWSSDGMNITGGVTVWVMYIPEGGGTPQKLDLWVPFQLKWNLPEAQNDGTIIAVLDLANIDCRSLSARKLMVRAAISAMADAWEPAQTELYTADQVGDNIHLLKKTYPMELPQEAGEKTFQLEEELNIPGFGDGCKMVHYQIQPQILEQKVMAGKLVFRGTCKVQGLFQCEYGGLKNWDMEMGFSQFADLDRDYGPNGTAWVIPVLTGAELEKNEQGKSVIKFGITCQYVIFDRVMVDAVEDAYCPGRTLQTHSEQICLPARLDYSHEQLTCRQTHRCDAVDVVDVFACWGSPRISHNEEKTLFALSPNYQVLYMDAAGELHSAAIAGETDVQLASDEANCFAAHMGQRNVQVVQTGDGLEICGNVNLDIAAFSQKRLSMVDAITIGEIVAPDPGRPSLVLCRCSNSSLWNLAKKYGSTVEQIKEINMIADEPAEDQLIMIPVN